MVDREMIVLYILLSMGFGEMRHVLFLLYPMVGNRKKNCMSSFLLFFFRPHNIAWVKKSHQADNMPFILKY